MLEVSRQYNTIQYKVVELEGGNSPSSRRNVYFSLSVSAYSSLTVHEEPLIFQSGLSPRSGDLGVKPVTPPVGIKGLRTIF